MICVDVFGVRDCLRLICYDMLLFVGGVLVCLCFCCRCVCCVVVYVCVLFACFRALV